MAINPNWGHPTLTRSLIVLEIANEMLKSPQQVYRQAMVSLREEGTREWKLGLFGSNSHEGVEAVVSGQSTVAIVNPSAQLAFAYLGSAPYDTPQPVRTIAVIPSYDQFVFAVRKETGLRTLEEIATTRYPLHVSVRGQEDHSIHYLLSHIISAAGFTEADLKSWGGELRKEGSLPYPASERFQALVRGDIDAIFDEGAEEWIEAAIAAGLTILRLSEETIQKVEAVGGRRAVLKKSLYPELESDILTVDFSGWPIFVHADTPDEIVTEICAGLEARKNRIPWQGSGPLPTERMCQDFPENPLDVPLHPAAERFWQKCGYLTKDLEGR